MKLPWKIIKVSETPSDLKLEQIKNILFPPLELHEKAEQDGTFVKFHIDYSADSNLDAVLMDLQDGLNDQGMQKTVDSVIKRLHKVRRLLEAYAQLDKEARYIIVDDKEEELNVKEAE